MTGEYIGDCNIKHASLTFQELKNIIEYRMDCILEMASASEGLFDYSEDIRCHEFALKILQEIFEERKQYKERGFWV